MIREKKYATGEVPRIGDFVYRQRRNQYGIVVGRNQYGIVVGLWRTLGDSGMFIPIIHWAGSGFSAKKSLPYNVLLVARADPRDACPL